LTTFRATPSKSLRFSNKLRIHFGVALKLDFGQSSGVTECVNQALLKGP
jgi:hypothetical protein